MLGDEGVAPAARTARRGVPTWTIRPSRMTAIRWPMRQRLELVGRGVEHGHAELAVQPLELGPHVVAQLGVEIGQGLVEQQQLGPADQGAADRDPLLLAARSGRRACGRACG